MRNIRIIDLLVVISILATFFSLFPMLAYLGVVLGTGWLMFIARALAQGSLAAAVILGVLLGLVILTGCLHALCQWCVQGAFKYGNSARAWKVRWTAVITVFLLSAVGVGEAIRGLVRDAAWFYTTDTPIYTSGREPSARRTSRNNLKQVGLAFHNYYDTHGSLPPGATFDRFGRSDHSWQTYLLPWIDQQPLYNQIDFSKPWDDPANAEWMTTRVQVYLNYGMTPYVAENNDGYALSHYAGNKRVLGGQAPLHFKQVTDGLSNTLFAGEVNANFKAWGEPPNVRDPALGINTAPDGFGGPWQADGANFLLMDGSVRWLDADIDRAVLRALSTPAGGEPIIE